MYMFESAKEKGKLSFSMHNIPCCMYYLLTATPDQIECFFDGWRGDDILNVVKWTEDTDYEWALHLNLSEFHTGHEAILPFPWAEDHVPETIEGLYAWRLFTNKEE